MRFGQIREFDIANGEGIRVSLFVTGCYHNCKGCFNKEYQSFDHGQIWSEDHMDQLIEYLKNPMVDGLSLLGGEPMEHPEELCQILQKVKEQVDKNIWIYSGYTLEQILLDEKMKKLLKQCHVLVDGLFVENQKDIRLRFRGSSNQRLLDIQQSLKQSKPILWQLRE